MDPLESNHVRYVGKTINWWRPRFHEKEALTSKKFTHKIRWILKLLAAKRTYDVITIKQLPYDVSDELLSLEEKFFIAKYRAEGHRLTNATDGGEGCIHPSQETRIKMGIAQKRIWNSPIRLEKQRYRQHSNRVKRGIITRRNNQDFGKEKSISLEQAIQKQRKIEEEIIKVQITLKELNCPILEMSLS